MKGRRDYGKTMKKLSFRIISIILCALMLLPVFAGCGEEKKPETTTAAADATEPETTTEEAGPEPVTEIDLAGKKILWLGSSVTYGSANNGKSMVEYIAERNGCTCTKSAVSGTTLVNNDNNSYVGRLNSMINSKISKFKKCDYFIIQLSTNDATQNKPLGKISDSKNKEDFDLMTITGAMEYIIAAVKERWGCPVAFYTGTKYSSAPYQKMVDRLFELKEKWGIGVIDLWNDEEMNAVSKKDYAKYMSDSIHPNGTGYLEWWTPKFEEFLKNPENWKSEN